jgi:hypothetical protein
MSSPAKNINGYPMIQRVSVTDQKITAEMSDGREVSIPVSWFPRLQRATAQQRSNLKISPGGYGIHWPEIDEDISIKAFLG